MVSNPFPRVLLISFFLATLSLAFNPGSKRGHLNRRSPEPFPLSATEQKTTSSTPSFTDFSSRPDLSIGFRRSSSLPNNFSPLSSYKSALDTADWSAGSSAPSSHGSDGAFGTSSYPSVSTTPSDSPRSGSGSAKLADFRSPNNRGEQPLPADVLEAKIKETYRSDQNLAPISRPKVRWSGLKPSATTFSSRLAKMKSENGNADSSLENVPERWPTKLRTKLNRWTAMARPVGPNQQQMDQNPVAGRWNRLGDRIGNAWGRMKIAGSNIGENVRGLFKGGNPSAAVSGARQEAGKEKNIALAAEPLPSGALDKYLTNPANSHIKEAISQLPQTTDAYQLVSYSDPTAPGGVQLYRFYNKPNHNMYRENVGDVPPILHDAKKAEAEIKETYRSDQNLAPISRPKVRWSGLKPSATTFSSRLAKMKSENGNADSFLENVPERWPTKLNQLSTRIRTEVKQWPTRVRTEVKQWPTRVRTEVKQWPTRVRTEVNRLKALARPVGPNQQQMDQNPVAGRWNRLGDRIGNAWGRMKIAGSNIGENVRGLFKGGNPSAAVSSAREVARPIRR
ncbi:hypothetical protein NDA18_004497 [Ustilago nuda]|nr:hypothetical protein NDA18_004497 [Ustilago nuda]